MYCRSAVGILGGKKIDEEWEGKVKLEWRFN
jgi:hypothetical protein